MQESTEFLQWLTDDSFIYLGYREYQINGTGDDATVSVVPGSGLGVMSDEARSRFAKPVAVAALEPAVRGRIFGGPLVVVSKTNAETTIHRRARMDYIGVKRMDADGNLVGELRLIGLFTSKAYAESARQIPLVRRKLEAIMRWEDLITGSHDYKAVVELFDSFPKDELFAAPAQELRATIMALAAMQEERNVRVFLRVDPMWRTVWAVVALPRDRVTDGAAGPARAPVRVPLPGRRRRLRAVLCDRSRPASTSRSTSATRASPTCRSPSSSARSSPPPARGTTRSPTRLPRAVGEMRGHELARRYAALFPEYYKSASGVEAARFDVEQFELLGPERPYVVALQNERGPAEPLTRVKLYKTGGKAPLTELLPLLEQLGLTVVEEVPTRLHRRSRPRAATCTTSASSAPTAPSSISRSTPTS